MKKDLLTKTGRPSFLKPWFEDFFEPTRRFNDFFLSDVVPFFENDRSLAPAIDIDESAEAYIVTADLPGVKKEDISVECADHQLTISAERKSEKSEGKKTGRRERYYGTYQRSFSLPNSANTDKVEATYNGGVLTVRIPKGEQAKARRIEIGEAKH